jgi:glutamate 5-kinase
MEGSNMKGPKQLIIVIKLGEIPFLNTPRTCLTVPGTSSIVDEVTHQPILSVLSMIVETAIKLLKDGHRVIIVSSGAIGVGLRRMDIAKKPPLLPKVQVWPCVSLIFPSARPNGDDRRLPQ